MNNSVYDIDYTRLLPEPLKNDSAMLALGVSISDTLQENIRLARLDIIYARIDELDELTLDILARDFHVDWYNDTYPIEAKRAIIKSSVRIHKRLGTKFAIVKAIGDIFPNSEVQEWFEYGGTHHRFRIILDLTNAKIPPDLTQIIKAAKFYKRLSAHLDEVIYQMSAVITISTDTAIYRFHTGVTGKEKAGMRPYVNYKGGAANAKIEALSGAQGKSFQSEIAGTIPQRSRIAALRKVDINAEGKTKNYYIISDISGRDKAGEFPYRNTAGDISSVNVDILPENSKHEFKSTYSGEKPHTNIEGQKRGGGLMPSVNAESFFYCVRRCGTSRCGK